MRLGILIILALSFGFDMQAQHQLYKNKVSTNFGLTRPMEAEALPYSKAPLAQPERVQKIEAKTILLPVQDNVWEVSQGWELADSDLLVKNGGNLFSSDYNTDLWYNATVPGTVLTTLVQQGVYLDPCYGVNNMSIPEDLCRKDWWYRVEIPLSEDLLAKPTLELLFNGINYRADVWMNGEKLGNISGAFIRGRFDITKIARENNVLAVHIFPPSNPGFPHEQSSISGRGPNGGQLCLDGPTFISSEGWDWVPGIRDRNIGLWQDVQIIASDGVTIGDTQVITDLPLPDTSYADIIIETSVKNNLTEDASVVLTARFADITIDKTVFVKAGTQAKVCFDPVRLQNPALWMPNGYGEPNLYDLSIVATLGGNKSDESKTSFGIRELSYELTVDAEQHQDLRICYDPTALRGEGNVFNNRMLRSSECGVTIPSLINDAVLDKVEKISADEMAPYLVIRCNGVRIYCKGGNWGMDDLMKRVSRERLEPYFLLHKEAGFTMIRNWTGESTEELFYQLADEYGLLVWNDFWMSTEGYNLDPLDEDLFMSNAVDVVRRFRNHPSIAIWCPRNEGYAPEGLESRLSAMLATEDGTRYYSPNSRYCNLRPSGPWHYFTDASKYFSEQAAGFNTELGSPSIPTARTIRKFMAPQDQWPISEAWHYHDLHPGTETYVAGVSKMYGAPTDLDDFCKKVQLMNYDSYRAMFESWNSRLWDNTSGVLLWMSHPAWPSVEWQTYSYDYETFGSWFGSKKACEALHVQMNLDDRDVVVINNTLKDEKVLTVSLLCRDLKGRKLIARSVKNVVAQANALTLAFKGELPDYEGVFIARVTLLDRKGRCLSVNDYIIDGNGKKDFTPLNALPNVTLKAECRKRGEDVVYKISNTDRAVAIGIKLNLEDGVTGQQILPAVFSDGYFNLYPGESREITVKYSYSKSVKLSAEGYNVNSEIK